MSKMGSIALVQLRTLFTYSDLRTLFTYPDSTTSASCIIIVIPVVCTLPLKQVVKKRVPFGWLSP